MLDFHAFLWYLMCYQQKGALKMKWNVIIQDSKTGYFKSYNIFEYPDFRISMENLFKRQYPQERFLSELDQEIHHYFRAKIEWEMCITAWPPHINSKEISRIISDYHINRSTEQPLPKQIHVNVTKCYKIDVYSQLRANWERFADYMLSENQKYVTSLITNPHSLD